MRSLAPALAAVIFTVLAVAATRAGGSSPLGGGGWERGEARRGVAATATGAPLLTSPLIQPSPSQGGGTHRPAPSTGPVAPRPSAAPSPLGLFRFTRLNHAYSEPATAIDPITEGPLTLRLASPRNKLVLVSNTLRLEPGVDGSHTADLEVQFFGKGVVVADVEVSGVVQHFEDEVVVPRQTRRLSGRVRVARTADGYVLTPERLPREMPVAFQSRLGNDVVGLCDRVAALPFSDLDCSGLARALSTAAVPLPPPGEGFYLARTDLTEAERRQLESYIAAGRTGRTRR